MAATNMWGQLLEDSEAFDAFTGRILEGLYDDADAALEHAINNCPDDAAVCDVIGAAMDVLAGGEPEGIDCSVCEDSRWVRLCKDPDSLSEVKDEILRLLFESFEAIVADVVHEYADLNDGAKTGDLILDVLDRIEDINGDALADLEDLVDGLTIVPHVQS